MNACASWLGERGGSLAPDPSWWVTLLQIDDITETVLLFRSQIPTYASCAKVIKFSL